MSLTIGSKWLKTQVLLSNASVANHIPETCLFTKQHLKNMLQKYGMVFVKPVHGGGGAGVIRVKQEQTGYSYTKLSRRLTFSNFDLMYASLLRAKKRRSYLIQRGIELAQIGGRPIDYRVKFVKQEAGWKITAMLGRLARPGLVITNVCKGGTLIKGRLALQQSLPHISARSKQQEMRNLTRVCTAILEERFPGIGQLGFDYGLDHSGKIWILEVNTRPQ
ncbi:YheC/YheD family protein [Paenibacillus urinalis]|uniref:YheC/YheD family protein n=1 Tax=Paenibacillus urinalis TaxID=521520 RepID=A0AAX3MYQ9_9BACL|nr:YheC/YheD family protein [Paenibacillus urinalis]WDH81934.1 YheC/YheD family protein [Paenibacillus urinalis]